MTDLFALPYESRVRYLLTTWVQDADGWYIDPYEVVEDLLTDFGKESYERSIADLDAWIATTTTQERHDAIDANDWMPFALADVDPFLEALRRRLVEGLERDHPTPMRAPDHLLHPRDVPEGPFPELLRLARYVEEHVSGQAENAFLDPEHADAVTVTSLRLHELEDMYHRRLLTEISELPPEALSTFPVEGVQEWIDIVEYIARCRIQRAGRPDAYSPEALADLRAQAE